jgi:hypothetical protein
MKKTLFATAFVLVIASTASAQSMITTTPQRSYPTVNDGFRIGPRVSNYATDIDFEIFTVDSGRQLSFGLAGDFRSGAFLLDFNYDHDPENGLQITDFLPIDFGRYSRDRGEVTIGWAAIPYLDLQGGLRFDNITLGGSTFGDDDFFGSEDFEFQGIGGGVKIHTATNRPFGVYGVLRGFTGTVDTGGSGFGSQIDATVYRAEGGFVIPIGESNWSAVPGLEFETFDTEGNLLTLETNRVFVNILYQFPR